MFKTQLFTLENADNCKQKDVYNKYKHLIVKYPLPTAYFW